LRPERGGERDAERRPRRTRTPDQIAACGAGRPSWWVSDGRLVPLRYANSLRALCDEIEAAAHHGRGTTPALPARSAGLPAIAIGCLDSRGLAPRSHQQTDTPELIDEPRSTRRSRSDSRS